MPLLLRMGWFVGPRGNGYWARIRPRVTGAWSSPHPVQCFALLHCIANQINAACCLAFATPGGYRKFLSCLGQLAPTTLPQRRLVSNLSLCGPLSLCVLLSLRQGGMSSSSPSQGGFSSSSPSPRVSLCPSLPLFSASSYPPPCLPVLLRRTAVRTAACSAACRGTLQRPL